MNTDEDPSPASSHFSARLIEKLEGNGWTIRQDDNLLKAEKEVILAKWLLGSRKVKHRLTLRLDTPVRELRMQETATETTIGVPPPFFSTTLSRQKGLEVEQDRVDTGTGGGGTLHYGEPRKWIAHECTQAGWTFKLVINAV